MNKEIIYLILNVLLLVGAFLLVLASGIALYRSDLNAKLHGNDIDSGWGFMVLLFVFIAALFLFSVYFIQLMLTLNHEFVMFQPTKELYLE